MPDFDYHDALIEIEMLFQGHILSFGYKEYSLENYVDKKYFLLWQGREGNHDTDEMRSGLYIDGILKNPEPSESEILTYLQYTLNIAELCRRNFNANEEPGYSFDIRSYTELLTRIRDLIRRLHYDTRFVEEKELIYLVPHDPEADLAADEAEDPVQSILTQYRSAAVTGQLEQKQKLLAELSDTVMGYKDDSRANMRTNQRTKFLLDALNIRPHEEHEDYERIQTMNTDELEDWYDEAYRLLLLRIMEHSNLARIEKIDELARECGVEHVDITDEEMDRLLSGPGIPEDLMIEEKAQEEPAVSEDQRDEIGEYSVRSGDNTVRNVVIALILADLIFVSVVLWYLFLV